MISDKPLNNCCRPPDHIDNVADDQNPNITNLISLMTARNGLSLLAAGIVPYDLSVKSTLKAKTSKEASDFLICLFNQLRHKLWIPATVTINNHAKQVIDTIPLPKNN
jgi:hypothetical protein